MGTEPKTQAVLKTYRMCKYFLLQASLDCSVQKSSFPFFASLWHFCHFCHIHHACLWHHRYRLLGMKWRCWRRQTERFHGGPGDSVTHLLEGFESLCAVVCDFFQCCWMWCCHCFFFFRSSASDWQWWQRRPTTTCPRQRVSKPSLRNSISFYSVDV